jgi:diguanylate cyclase (GGDEF)-like protein
MHEVANQCIAEGVTTQAEINRVIGAAGEPSAAARPARDADDIIDAEIIEVTAADALAGAPLLHAAADTTAHLPALRRDAGAGRADAVRSLLYGLDRCVAEGQPIDDVLAFACSRLSAVFDSPLVWAALPDGAELVVRARAGACAPWFNDVVPDADDLTGSGTVVATALLTGAPHGCHISQDDVDTAWRESARVHGVPIFLAIPVNAGAGRVGVIGVHVRGMDMLDPQAGAELVNVVERIGAALQRLSDLRTALLQLAAVTVNPLTQLPNGRGLEADLAKSIAAVASGAPDGALLLIRIDGGAALRESMGHAVADARVVQVSAALTQTLRPGDFLALLGDDEFAAILPATPLDGAAIVIERVSEVIAGWRFDDEQDVAMPLTVSIGISPIDGTQAARAVIATADASLCGSRDRMVGSCSGPAAVHDESGDEEWARRIRDALDNEQFVLYFQPVVRLRTGAVAHYDALIRLHDDSGDVIPARTFIRHAENAGLMPRLDQWVLENVLRVLRTAPELRVSMNLGTATVTSPLFRQFLQKQHRRMSAVGARLIFEVAEVAVADDLPGMLSSMQRLGELGCRFALDNFGMGATSIASLGALPVDYIKLDGALVRGVEDDEARAEIVRALVTVARALGKEAIAGCAERQSTVDLLPRLGIDLALGHCLGRPTPELGRDGRSFMAALRRDTDVPHPAPLPSFTGPACRLDPLVA